MDSGFEAALKPLKYLIPVNVECTRVHFIVTEAYLSTSRDILSYLVENFL